MDFRNREGHEFTCAARGLVVSRLQAAEVCSLRLVIRCREVLEACAGRERDGISLLRCVRRWMNGPQRLKLTSQVLIRHD
jgi:hypothetical protein